MAGWLFYLLVVLVALCLIALGALAHAGFFSDLRIRTSIPVSCPKRVAYSLYTGPYKQAGSSYHRICTLAPNRTPFALYYDDPNEIPAAELRYIVGCVLPEASESQLEEMLKTNGFSVWTFPSCSNAVITEFPARSFLSYWIAPAIVYPALKKYFKKKEFKTGPIIELCTDDVMRYIAPLENIQGFFVPEVAQKEESKKEQ